MQWDGVEKSAVQEKKIRVAWLAPNEGVATPIRQTATNGVCFSCLAFECLTTTNALCSSTLPLTPHRRPPIPPRRTTPPSSRTPPPFPTRTSRNTSPNPHKPPRPRPSPLPSPPPQAASDPPRPKPTRSSKSGSLRRKRPPPLSRTNWLAGCGSARQGTRRTTPAAAAARGRRSLRRPRGNRRGAPRACPSGSWPSSASSAFCWGISSSSGSWFWPGRGGEGGVQAERAAHPFAHFRHNTTRTHVHAHTHTHAYRRKRRLDRGRLLFPLWLWMDG